MTSVDQASKYSKQYQDIELSNALQQLRNDPVSLQQFLQNAQTNLYTDVIAQKDGAFQKIYGDLQRASSTDKAVQLYNQRNEDVNNLQSELYNARKGETDAVIHDINLAKRQSEINQWSTGNKLDTLFVYQQIFIILCTVVFMTYLLTNGVITTGLYFSLLFVLICIAVFTIVDRAQYTQFLRDGRYWNKRKFPTYSTIIPNVCPQGNNNGSTTSSTTLSSVEQELQNDISSATQNASSAWKSATNSINNMAKKTDEDLQVIYNNL
jgi:hypothetical protein